jgi:hypothetical protein
MRTNFSPIAEAARRQAAVARSSSTASMTTSGAGASGATCELSCEWPRRMPSLPPFRGVRHALQQIQALQSRHA